MGSGPHGIVEAPNPGAELDNILGASTEDEWLAPHDPSGVKGHETSLGMVKASSSSALDVVGALPAPVADGSGTHQELLSRVAQSRASRWMRSLREHG